VNRATLAAIAGLLALAAAVAWAIGGRGPDLGPRQEKPTLALLTSLPLVFGETFGIGGGSPALARLEQRYTVQPIPIADAASLKGQKMLLMAHPRAQPAEVLVELDRWVRDGGRVLLLADPRLDWPSERPLGDTLRPPPAFADTGLLAHWGLRLVGPEPGITVGRLLGGGQCKIDDSGVLARCRIGKGQATVIADADFLNVQPGETDKLDQLLAELGRLETR
jgi:hypothetical protein